MAESKEAQTLLASPRIAATIQRWQDEMAKLKENPLRIRQELLEAERMLKQELLSVTVSCVDSWDGEHYGEA